MEKGKYLSGIMAALSTMVTLEIPHINVMTKVDVLSPKAKEALEEYVDPSNYCKIEDKSPHGAKYTHLANQLFQVIEDFSLVTFYPLDRSDESSVEHVVAVGKLKFYSLALLILTRFSVDMMIQYGEDQDVKARDDPEISEEQEDFMEKQMRELGIQ